MHIFTRSARGNYFEYSDLPKDWTETYQITNFVSFRTLTEMVPLLGTDELKPFSTAIPKLIEVCANLVTVDEVTYEAECIIHMKPPNVVFCKMISRLD